VKNAGIVDQDIDSAENFHRFLEDSLNLVLLRHVGGYG
jgi:hypothetical protein